MAEQDEIIVFSPHLDDAALDCADHILAWKKLGLHVRVVTVFTKSASQSPADSSCDSLDALERRRTYEDKEAMRLLGVSWNHLSFADEEVRRKKNWYGTSERLGLEAPNARILGALVSAITPFRNGSLFVSPLGIGGHIDHLLVREAAQFKTDPAAICYYVDYPYALSVLNWTRSDILRVIRRKKSIKVMSKAKKQLLETYSSQIPPIFSHTRFSVSWITWTLLGAYPEILLYHKHARLCTRK